MAYLLGKPVKNLAAIPTNHGLRAMIAGSATGRDAATQPSADAAGSPAPPTKGNYWDNDPIVQPAAGQ
jgi:hypothetical protein